jgi:hypothetical protein
LKEKNIVAIVLLLIGLLVAPFFKDTIGTLFLFVFIGGAVVLLVIFVIIGSLMMVFRGA